MSNKYESYILTISVIDFIPMQIVQFVLQYSVLLTTKSSIRMDVGLANVTVLSVDPTVLVINLLVNVFVILGITISPTSNVSKVRLFL